jgi:hypothetical protein
MGSWVLRGVKRPGRGVEHPPLSSAEIKERVELYFYSPLRWAFMACSRVNFTFSLLTLAPFPPQRFALLLYWYWFRGESKNVQKWDGI